MSDYDDYEEKLFFEPDYSVYKTARKLKNWPKKETLKYIEELNFI